jgi:hypothetical protein
MRGRTILSLTMLAVTAGAFALTVRQSRAPSRSTESGSGEGAPVVHVLGGAPPRAMPPTPLSAMAEPTAEEDRRVALTTLRARLDAGEVILRSQAFPELLVRLQREAAGSWSGVVGSESAPAAKDSTTAPTWRGDSLIFRSTAAAFSCANVVMERGSGPELIIRPRADRAYDVALCGGEVRMTLR